MASTCFGRLKLGGVVALLALTASEKDRRTEPAAPVEEAIAQAVAPGFQEELFVSGRTEPTAVRERRAPRPLNRPDPHVAVFSRRTRPARPDPRS